jgi:hypothetical protein
MPRPFHPDRDIEAQDNYKKGLRRGGKKSQTVRGKHGRRLRIMFADEARFGRMNRPRPCWAPASVRPAVASQRIREFIYLYGAVSPMDGACSFLILPAARYGVLSDFPRQLGQTIFQATYPTDFGRRPQSYHRRSANPRQHHARILAAMFTRIESSGKYLGRDPGENL